MLSLAAAPVSATAGPAAAAEAPGVWPIQPTPQVVRGFDPPEVRWGAGHRGVDLAGSVGQPVHAARAGTVTFAGRIAGRGVVAVTHGATRTTYEPVTPTVARGAVVGRGEVIGALAWYGSHCLPRACLHWGLIAGSTYLDPLTLVGGGPQPVRLLPLDGVPRAPVGQPPTGSLVPEPWTGTRSAGPAAAATTGASLGAQAA